MARLLNQLMTGSQQRGSFTSKDQIKQQVQQLAEACPSFVRLVSHNDGTLVKVSKNLNWTPQQFREAILNHLNK